MHQYKISKLEGKSGWNTKFVSRVWALNRRPNFPRFLARIILRVLQGVFLHYTAPQNTDNMGNNRRRRKIASIVTITCPATTVAIAARKRRKGNHMRSLQLYIHICSLLHPLRSKSSTHWKQLLSCSTSSDFIREINFERYCVLTMLMPRFELMKQNVEFESPYRCGPKNRGCKPLLESIDILEIVLKYLKSTTRQYELSGMYWVVPSTLSEWVNYGLIVLFRALQDKSEPAFWVTWPSVQYMDASCNLSRLNRSNGCLLPNLLGVVDGRFMLGAYYSNINLQNAYYKKYTGNVKVFLRSTF